MFCKSIGHTDQFGLHMSHKAPFVFITFQLVVEAYATRCCPPLCVMVGERCWGTRVRASVKVTILSNQELLDGVSGCRIEGWILTSQRRFWNTFVTVRTFPVITETLCWQNVEGIWWSFLLTRSFTEACVTLVKHDSRSTVCLRGTVACFSPYTHFILT